MIGRVRTAVPLMLACHLALWPGLDAQGQAPTFRAAADAVTVEVSVQAAIDR